MSPALAFVGLERRQRAAGVGDELVDGVRLAGLAFVAKSGAAHRHQARRFRCTLSRAVFAAGA